MADTRPEYSCPHCEARLLPWQSPDLTTWGGKTQYICFNDDCPYFVRGWDHLKTNFDVVASYRHRFDPDTGQTGPLPVWSPSALKNQIVDSEEKDQ